MTWTGHVTHTGQVSSCPQKTGVRAKFRTFDTSKDMSWACRGHVKLRPQLAVEKSDLRIVFTFKAVSLLELTYLASLSFRCCLSKKSLITSPLKGGSYMEPGDFV